MRKVGSQFFIFILFATIIFGAPRAVFADAASDIQSQIDANSKQISSLENEIAIFQKQLDTLGETKNTLQSTISSLTLSQKQLATQIQVTQSKIASANLKIQQLTLSIGSKETSIAENQSAITSSLKSIAENEGASLIVGLVSSKSLGDAWKVTDDAIQFNKALGDDIDNLRAARTTLASNRDEVTKAKANLVSLQNNLTVQKRSVDASKAAQQQLLSQTKNQESNYQKLIAQKQAAEKESERELADLQSQLNLIVNPKLLPKTGSGILSWPYSAAFMFNCSQRSKVFGNLFCITQYFGNTPFATANSQVYNGHGHDGIDIGSPIGTPIQASMSGTVLATGNTDLAHDSKGNKCYSFGKWVMLAHNDGINTMYAHLSEIDVSAGQSVSRGQLLGLSGMTGYATAPHLHFGVYAADGTEIKTLSAFRGATTACANATMPVATLTAYLNPLSYL